MDNYAAERKKRNRWLVITCLAALSSLVALVIGTLSFYQKTEQLRLDAMRQLDYGSRLRQLQTVLVTIGDAETGQRGYLLTGKSRYLVPYQAARARLPELLRSLDGEPLRLLGVEANALAAKRLIALKLGELAETIRLYDTGQHEAALSLVQTDVGQHYMEQIRVEVDTVLAVMRAERDAITHELAATNAQTRIIAGLLVTTLTVSMTLAVAQIVLLLRSQWRYQQALTANEGFLDRTGRLAGVGGWELDLRSRQVKWSSEVRRIHEVADDYEPTLDDAIRFYTEEAQVQVSVALANCEQRGTPFDLELMLVTAKGRQICVRAVGEAELGADGRPQKLVGAFQDVTTRKALEAELRALTDIIETTPDFVAQVDDAGHIQYLNPSLRQALGLDIGEKVSGHMLSEISTPDTERRMQHEILPTVAQEGGWLGEATIQLASRSDVPVSLLVIGHRAGKHGIARYSAVMRDISADVQNRRDLDLHTSTLRAIVESIPAMVAVFDRDFHYRLVNRAFEVWRGKERSSVVGHSVAELFGQAEYERSLPWARRALAGETVSYEKEYPSRINRNLAITYVPLRLEDGSIDGFVAVAQDITEQRDKEIRLLDLSTRDALTGLLNRAGFHQYLQDEWAAGRQANLGLLYIDLDRFKPVNDTYGHGAGDEVLQQFASRLKGLVRPSDAVARLGGDEFALALSQAGDRAVADRVADTVVAAAQQPFKTTKATVQIGASVGVAYGAGDHGGWQELLERADAMVYKAKTDGRGRRA